MKIAVGSDHAGLSLKCELGELLKSWGHEVTDVGTHDAGSVDYPDFARQVGSLLQKGAAERGLLCCGTGIGMSIAANRMAGVRAALVSDTFSAKMSRAHNDANLLCLGARVVGSGVAADCLRAFLETPFEGGRHTGRIAKIENS